MTDASDDERPEPPVPADANLREFPFYPVEIARLRNSKSWLAAKRRPELGFYMVNLWCSSFHEVPAGSLEDDDDVRIYSTDTLRELGYTVLEAHDGVSALRVLEHHPEIRLLFTDVGLPGINGRELVDAARAKRPDLRVLFTSGYERSALMYDSRLDAGVELLTKPFTRAQLAARIRAVLDADLSAA